MKYLISERQYKILTEQVVKGVNSTTLTPSQPSSFLQPTMNVASGVIDVPDISIHTLNTINGILLAFVPYAGPFLSAGVGLYDAKLYYDEGDTKSAGITAAFSMIPFIGKIPGVKELGTKGMALLGKKLAQGASMGGKIANKVATFSKSEVNVLNAIKQNEDLIRQGLENASKKLSPSVVESVESLKPTYISKFGQQKYDDLLGQYISGKVGKEGFLNDLKTASASTSKLAKMTVQSGVKFAKYELDDISELASEIAKGKEGVYKLELYIKGSGINVEVIVKSMPEETFAGQAVGRGKIYMNLDNLVGKSEQEVRQILTHEATHIKDPSLVSPKLNQSYDAIQTAKSSELKNFENLVSKAEQTGKGADDALKAGQKYKDLYQRYLYHPQEIVANNQMVLNNMTIELNNVIQKVGPRTAAKELDNVIAVATGKLPLSIESLELIGDLGFRHLSGLAKYNQKYYQDFLKKLVKQSEYLKSQLRLY